LYLTLDLSAVTRSRRTGVRTGIAGRLALALVAVVAWLAPASARAADGVYVAYFNSSISFVRLDDGGGMDLSTAGATLTHPTGLALDPAHGRVYWTEREGIWWAALDGSGHGGGPLNLGVAPFSEPFGLAIDPTAAPAGRIYWLNAGNSTSGHVGIAFADLDGSGGSELAIGIDANNSLPTGLALDPVRRIVYWGDQQTRTIQFAHLDGSGGGVVKTGGEPVSDPLALAVDAAAGRIYWVNDTVKNRISWADLANTGAPSDVSGHIATDPTTLDLGGTPANLAVDRAAGRIYWPTANSVAYAPLDGSGPAHELRSTGVSGNVLLGFVVSVAPRPAAPPAVSGASTAGGALSCSPGSWAPDLVESFLYAAPSSFAYQWSRDGADLPGATGPALVAPTAGAYACRVTAVNVAGTAVQTSAAWAVGPALPQTGGVGGGTAAFGTSARVTLALATSRVPARGPVPVRVTNGNGFAVAGTLAAQTTRPVAAAHHRRVKLRALRIAVAAHGRQTLRLVLPRSLRQLLARQRKLSLSLNAVVKDPPRHARTVRATVTPRLAPAKRR